MLASGIRILDHRVDIPRLDDGHGQPGQLELIGPLIPSHLSFLKRLFSNLFYFFMYSFFFPPFDGHVYTMWIWQRYQFVSIQQRRSGMFYEIPRDA
jgi:hypothetical protein